jgi:hypothetical protein
VLILGARAQVLLATEKGGRVNVQALSCARLAGTFREDADAIAMYYSGWYNCLANNHGFNIKCARELQHEMIFYCTENPDVKVIRR